MYFEVWKNDTLIRRGKQTLEPISFENELMYVPEFTLVLPIDWLELRWVGRGEAVHQ